MVKNDSKYWERRKADLIYRQMDKAESKADNIDKIYNEAQRYLNRQANKVFDKFQRDYGLSETDARKVIKDMNGKQNLSEMRKILEARPDDPNINQLLADMDSAAYTFRIQQFENLNKQVDKLRSVMYRAEKRQSDKFYTDFMKDSYNRATFDLQQKTGLAYSFSTLPEAEIRRLRSLKWSGDNYSSRIWDNTGELARQLKNEFLVSLMTGRGNRDVINLISERFNTGRNNARRLVRTESAFFHNEMEALSYEEADIEYYRFIAVLDKRTSAICREHDNKVYKVSERKTGVNYPPLHPWCRSTTVAHFDDVDLSNLERRARDPETGKAMLVPADMSYDDWHEKYIAKGHQKLYNNIDLNNYDNHTFENLKTVLHSANKAAERFKAKTGIDLYDSKFIDVSNRYDDNKAKFVKFLFSERGFDKTPVIKNNTEGMKALYRGVTNADEIGITGAEFKRRFQSGALDISGANRSAFGRGIYFGTEKHLAEVYSQKGAGGAIIEAYLPKEANLMYIGTAQDFTSRVANVDQIREAGLEKVYNLIYSGKGMDKNVEILAALTGHDGVISNDDSIISIFNRGKLVIKND